MKNSTKRHKEDRVMYVKVKRVSNMMNYDRSRKIKEGLYIINMTHNNGKPFFYLTPLNEELEPNTYAMFKIHKDELDRCPNSWVDMTAEITVLSRVR